jgi:hypothetical protein
VRQVWLLLRQVQFPLRQVQPVPCVKCYPNSLQSDVDPLVLCVTPTVRLCWVLLPLWRVQPPSPSRMSGAALLASGEGPLASGEPPPPLASGVVLFVVGVSSLASGVVPGYTRCGSPCLWWSPPPCVRWRLPFYLLLPGLRWHISHTLSRRDGVIPADVCPTLLGLWRSIRWHLCGN